MRRFALAVLLAPPLLVSARQAPPGAAERWTPFADTILTSARIVTVDRRFTIAQAIAVKEGRIIAVGTNADAIAHRGPATRVVDLAGKTIT